MASRFGHHIESLRSVPLHSHRESALLVSLSGEATIVTPTGEYTVAAREMVFIAGDTLHEAHTTSDHRSLSITFADPIARDTGIVDASGFVHDLIARISAAIDPARRDRLTDVLVDELAVTPVIDPQMQRAAELAPDKTVPEIARELGMSERTFRRFVHDQTGTSFTAWHQRQLCDRAIDLLRRGESVKAIAARFGYTSSAFIAMFRRVTGQAPARTLASCSNDARS
ncbi:MAG: helix-turn-helix transcriptional regulator [Kofleriaceae bacterium]